MAASVVDHIRPHRGDMVLFWDQTNHQSQCESCHFAKTMMEMSERRKQKHGAVSHLS